MDTFTILFDLNNLSEELDHLGNVFPDSLEKQENILDSLESLNLDTIDVDSLQSFKINGESVIDSIENTDFSSEVSKDSLNDSSSENFESCKTYISDEATLLCDETNEKDSGEIFLDILPIIGYSFGAFGSHLFCFSRHIFY